MPKISIASIKLDESTQSRAGIDKAAVAEYREAIKAGNELPPIVVFRVKGTEVFYMADGWHRLQAHIDEEFKLIDAEIRVGGQRDAMLYAVGANAEHGLRRTSADKRRAVELLMGDAEWSKWSDREIAKRCVVSHTLASEVRSSLSDSASDGSRKFTTKHGTDSVMKAKGVAGKAALPPPPPDDDDDIARDKDLAETFMGGPPPDEDAVVTSHSNAPDPAQPKHLPAGVEVFMQLHHKIHALKNEIAELAKTPLGSAIRIDQFKADMNNAANAVRFAAPFKDCSLQPNCKTGCKQCAGRGWITKEVWDRLPEGMK